MARQKFVHFVPRPKPRKRPGRHTKNLNKSKKRSYKKNIIDKVDHNKVDINPNKSYTVGMKEKIITIKVSGASQGQWSNLLLELNLIRKVWKTYGVTLSLKAPGIKNVIEWGTK